MDLCSQVDLMLIGKSGNGKSATGNSILRRKCFKTSGSATSVTNKIDCEVGKFDGRRIKVVDVPGVCDNSTANKDGAKFVVKCLQEAIYLNPEGYHAFILVLKYGGRLTAEEIGAVKFLKKVFGENFVRSYCILIITGGDMLENDRKATGTGFKKWCSEQKGDFKQLLEECCNRIVLFDNFTKDNYIRSKQLLKLLKQVDSLGNEGRRYTDGDFMRAEESRKKFYSQNKVAKIENESVVEISLLLDKMEKLLNSKDHRGKISPLEKVVHKDDQIMKTLEAAGDWTDKVKDLMSTAKSIKVLAEDEKKTSERFANEDERLRKLKEQIRAENERLEQQKKEMELLKENERLKAQMEQEKQKLELEKMKREQEQREERLMKEMKEMKLETERKLQQQEQNQSKTREKTLVERAINYAAGWIPGFSIVKQGYSVLSDWFTG